MRHDDSWNSDGQEGEFDSRGQRYDLVDRLGPREEGDSGGAQKSMPRDASIGSAEDGSGMVVVALMVFFGVALVVLFQALRYLVHMFL